ncbi:hypothetical protein ABZ863_28085 [Saccharomonospora sp. NPDC046836]|uniref:hypothetical protein n=1 Tax=Saccharomonospora sp. NPDC046836 TaxID=3156921 RepID=UPI0033E575F9
MIKRDRELLARAAAVNTKFGVVVSELMLSQDGGELRAARLRQIGQALGALSTDFLARAAELDGCVIDTPTLRPRWLDERVQQPVGRGPVRFSERLDHPHSVPSQELAVAANLLATCATDMQLVRFGHQHVRIPGGIDLLRCWMVQAAIDLEDVTDPPRTALDADVLEPFEPLLDLARRVVAELRRDHLR